MKSKRLLRKACVFVLVGAFGFTAAPAFSKVALDLDYEPHTQHAKIINTYPRDCYEEGKVEVGNFFFNGIARLNGRPLTVRRQKNGRPADG